MRGRRAAFWAVQGLLFIGAAALLWRMGVRYWDELRHARVTWRLHPGWLALAGATVLVTYGLLIEAWRRVVAGWNQRLPFRDAVRIWTIANLGRYIPGKIWTVAGMAVLAQRTGVAGWAAAGSAVVMQGITIGTGVALAVVMLPGRLHPVTAGAGVLVAALTVAVPAWPWAVGRVRVLVNRADLQPLRWTAVGAAALAAAASWVAYGLAFWCLVRGVLPTVQLPVPVAIGGFAAGYIAGLIAAFAPGGLGVREVTLSALIVGPLGAGGAGVAAAAQRVLFTLTEGLAALVGLVLGGLRAPHGDA